MESDLTSSPFNSLILPRIRLYCYLTDSTLRETFTARIMLICGLLWPWESVFVGCLTTLLISDRPLASVPATQTYSRAGKKVLREAAADLVADMSLVTAFQNHWIGTLTWITLHFYTKRPEMWIMKKKKLMMIKLSLAWITPYLR